MESRKELAAALVASGKSYVAAAAQLGLGERTIRGWAKEPEFAHRVKGLRGELVSAACGQLASAMSDAVAVLQLLLESADEGVRYRAARTIAELVVKLGDAASNAERLDALEAVILAQGATR